MTTLPSDSYTAGRLEHATPRHLHLTTRRSFVGPIPEGWLNSHRKQWYRDYFGNAVSGRAPSFTAAQASGNEQYSSTHQQPSATSADTRHRFSSQSADTQPVQYAVAASTSNTSSTSLLHGQRENERGMDGLGQRGGGDAANTAGDSQEQGDTSNAGQSGPDRRGSTPARVPFTEATRLQLRTRAQRMAARGNIRSSKTKPGELMKMDKMLVRIDVTQQSIKEGFDERVSQGVETKPLDKWREFMVVCRRHAQGAVLQFYQTRVIAATTDQMSKKAKSEVVLHRRDANTNLYSSLDKTLCVWKTDGSRTYIHYLRPQSGAASVEWWSFLRFVLGYGRARTLQVNVPDLSVSLRLDDPFETLESSQLLQQAAEGDEDALAKAVSDEQGAAGAIVARCIEMLSRSPQWKEVLRMWSENDRIGLAWKRYDRLEWVYGAVEERMYGTLAMQRTHDLELRPKDHYPSVVKTEKDEVVEEPPPVEGFLIRLTSQRGNERRMGKLMFKRLYFTSQNRYLVFTPPARATPPPLPKLATKRDGHTPSTQQFMDQVPLTFDVNPYPLEGNRIAWLNDEGTTSLSEQRSYDRAAEAEAARNVRMLRACDGFIDLCDVQRVRKYTKNATPADRTVDDDGSDVDFHYLPAVQRGEDGQTTEIDGERIFELLMKNGLVIRLQAYNAEARAEWMKRLRPLMRYWKRRSDQDMELFKSVRQQNLDALQIDERAEAQVGSFAYKWEVSQSSASPTLYNMCGISSCRPIHLSGTLFRKPRRHATFTRCHVILSAGHLLIFQDTLRKQTGKKLVHSHLERLGSVDLQGCYLYSGLLTENDLLYQNQTFDANTPGHHSLPRIYLEDAWTSTDEDAMTTFVIWHAKSKSWFRSSQSVDDVRTAERVNSINSRGEADDGRLGKTKTKLTRVSQLGVTGRSVVFKARSRAERDHWVLAIQVEIERLAAQNEEVRLVDGDTK